jgi:hypothetical protein
MHNSKFLELIYSLNSEEHKKLLKFLPFSTLSNHTTIYKLVDYTVQQISLKKRNNTTLEKRNVYQNLFPKESYNEQKINKLLSDSNKAIEGFIIYQTITNDAFYYKMALVNFYHDRKLDKHFESELKQTELLIQSMNESVEKLMFVIQLNEKKYESDAKKNNRQSDKQVLYDSIRNYSQLAEIKYRNYTLVDLHSDLVKKECTNILYQIHVIIHKLLHQHNLIDDFESCFNLILQNKEKIDNTELRDCIVILINIAILQANDGLENARERLFSLFDFLIVNNLILESNNTIVTGHYKNITTLGLYLYKFDYVDNFIETYKNNLHEDVKDDVYGYNKANLLYYKNEYAKVLQLISTTKYKDVFYRLDSRVLLIKTYYALEKTDASYFDILNNSINAFKKYVYSNDELNDYYKTRYKNFIKSVLRLVQLNNDKIQIQKYVAELSANKDVLEQKWLIRKAEELL